MLGTLDVPETEGSCGTAKYVKLTRLDMTDMTSPRSTTGMLHVRHSEEWFLANPVVRNPNLMIEFDEFAWNYTATSIIMWNLTSFCKGTVLHRSERLASSQSCQYILWDEETDFYPAQRLGLLGGKSPMNAWTSLQAIQAMSIVMNMWISWKTAMKLWSFELCWSVFRKMFSPRLEVRFPSSCRRSKPRWRGLSLQSKRQNVKTCRGLSSLAAGIFGFTGLGILLLGAP